MNPAFPIALATAASLAGVGCASRASKNDCQLRFEASDYTAALSACELRFTNSQEPEAGARATISAFMSGDGPRGASLLERLAEVGEHRAAGRAWHIAGDYRRFQGDRVGAVVAYERALNIHQQFSDDGNTARDQLSLSEVAWLEADYESAILRVEAAEVFARSDGGDALIASALQQHLSILYDLGAYGDAREVLSSLRVVVGADDAGVRSAEGLLHADAGRGAMAHASFEQALKAASTGNVWLRRATLLNLVRADLERHRPEHATAHLAAAHELADTDTGRIAVAAYRARVANARGDGALALTVAEAALAAAPISDWRWELELEAGRGAVATGDLSLGERHYLAATKALDEMRGAHDRADHKQSMLARKRAPYDALVDLYVAMDRPREALAIAERARGRTLVEAIANRSLKTVPVAARAAQRALAVSIDDALAAIGDAVAVAYYRTRTAVYRFEVKDGAVSAHRLAVSPADLDRDARALRADPANRAVAERLGVLLAPPSSGRLYVVADGALANAPLAALRVDGRYLAELSELAFAPSLSTLAALAGEPSTPHHGAIVIGDPRGDLEAARHEALTVAKILGVDARVGDQARLKPADSNTRPRLLHLATHADQRGAVLANGILSAADVIARGLAPELVVLATCRGAAPRDGGLWGSLAGSFLVAGSRVVIASPATLDDAHARQLVLAFYAAGGIDAPAAALVAAQRQMINRGSSAATWSSMMAIGLAHGIAKQPTTANTSKSHHDKEI